jgi:predicted nucleic acid-binding protein
MRIVLDTSALFYPKAIEAARASSPAALVLPTVVLLERARQLTRAGLDGPAEMAAFVESGGVELEAFGGLEAVRSARLAPVDPLRWARLSRDVMIAGHLGAGDVLWTANPRDFRELGIPAAQLLDVTRF